MNVYRNDIEVCRKKSCKQNGESTEEYSKSIVRKNNDTFRKKDWSQQVKTMQVPKGQDQMSGGVSVPCHHAKSVANAPWKLPQTR